MDKEPQIQQNADQDSDSIYVTDQSDIVECARQFYKEHRTIENNIPKEKNKYNNTLENFARIDNELAAAQMAIGESSNLAQLCLTYTYNFNEDKYKDYVCILSVIAQCAIDNAKRKFDIDIPSEIRRIKNDMNLKNNGYPNFWRIIRKGFDTTRINESLLCPMNYIYDIKVDRYSFDSPTIPISNFFIKYKLKEDRRKCKKVEDLIQKYSLDLYDYNMSEDFDWENYFILKSNFEEMITDIKNVHISNNYLGLMCWLIDRSMRITPDVGRNGAIKSKLNKNRSLLLKTLYDVNKTALLKCFSGNIDEKACTFNKIDNQNPQ